MDIYSENGLITEVTFKQNRARYHRLPSTEEERLMAATSDENLNFDDDEGEYLMKKRSKSWSSKNVSYYLCCEWLGSCFRWCQSCCLRCLPKKIYQPRTLHFNNGIHPQNISYPPNVIRNQKYNIFTFIPLVLFEQFRMFLNLYFLILALSQFIPELRVGYLYTYWGPLGFVLFITICREGYDDFMRFLRDKEINNQKYIRLSADGQHTITSAQIKVGDVILVNKNQRIPADMVLLRTSEKTGSCFIRTDQLDGETDWKLRLAVSAFQHLPSDSDIFHLTGQMYAEKPQKDIHNFIGTFIRHDAGREAEEPLTVEHTLWASTVVAAGNALGVVIYTGSETRSRMNTSEARAKIGLIDLELNLLTKVLFFFLILLTIGITAMKGFDGIWWRYMFRFLILFSNIIPLSLRVTLDLGKMVYSWMIGHDKNIPGTIVRSTTIPEELGRVQYLLSDKTGTLTQNVMIFKRLQLGTVAFSADSMTELKEHLKTSFEAKAAEKQGKEMPSRAKYTVITRVYDAVRAIALCHNVTPVYDLPANQTDIMLLTAEERAACPVTYQASSPDEVALVSWTESAGLTLVNRDLNMMTLRTPLGDLVSYTILQVFPFTSDSKRMGIILKDVETGEITFFMKGADTIMQTIVKYNDWLEEECGNMAREGLRTLVVAKKSMTQDLYDDFERRYHQAKMSTTERSARMAAVVESLEKDLELLCVTGVEDKLQENVRPTLELLRNAGVKVWMLTGDKLETATCIAKSSRLVSRSQSIFTFKTVKTRAEAHEELNAFRRRSDTALIITGSSLDVCLRHYELEFIELACQCSAVVVCRCSPTQKAEIVQLVKRFTDKIVAAIGDGGNDVSMIQAANVGVGIEGKEGKQASLAADFSMTQFSYIGRLLLVHGRNSYQRTAALSQFIIHRGVIFTVMQVVFSAVFYLASIMLYPGFLIVGYATVFTMFPVFSLVLDHDVSPDIAMTFPELYKMLSKGRSLNFKTFFLWLLISTYQGAIIMYGSFLLFDDDFLHIVAITFTSLILTELLMVTLTVHTWHWLMIVGEILSFTCYVICLVVFKDFFDAQFLKTLSFVWKVSVITSVSCIPLFVLKYVRFRCAPPMYTKLT